MASPTIAGDHLFTENGSFSGMIGGSDTVAPGVELMLSGSVGHDLHVGSGAVVHMTGTVGHDLRLDPGAVVYASGRVGGNTINMGGSVAEPEACMY